MVSQGEVPPLDGELRQISFAGGSLKTGVVGAFRDFRGRPGVQTVLVLTRSTALVPTVEAWLDDAGAATSEMQVDVQSLTQHAAQTHTPDADRRVATRAEQRAVLISVAEDYDWGRTFLEGASEQASFITDLSPLVTSALTQDIRPGDVDDADLRTIIAFAYEVKERLEAAGRTDLSRVIHLANRAMENGAALPNPVPDAVLVVNFEEFADRERRYVAHVSYDRPLVCVAQEASSIYRVGEEPGDPCTHPGLKQNNEMPPTALQSEPEAVATRLATGQSHAAGDVPGPGSAGETVHLQGETFETHVRAFADEIQRLHNEDGLDYSDISVAVRDTRAPISDVVQVLWNQNIPVTSTTVSGLEYDPAARELYQVLKAIAALRGGREIPDEVLSGLRTQVEDIEADVDAVAYVRATLEDAADVSRFDDALATWIAGTELKGRIASTQGKLQARISFENVEEVLDIARFIEEQDLCRTWEFFLETMERFYDRETSDRLSDDLESATTGVRVDTARALKGDRRRSVFVVGVVEGEFPQDVPTNPLFPTARASRIDNFPLLTDPDPGDVIDTFPTVESESEFDDPLRAYYQALDRRLLAVAAQAAEERLYLGSYRQGQSGLSKYQPSRFFETITDEADLVKKSGQDSTKSPERGVVAGFDDSRRDLLEASRTGPVSYDVLRDRFRVVQSLLETLDSERARDALRTRVELARGEIRRQSPAEGHE